jgi:hypothetical protein
LSIFGKVRLLRALLCKFKKVLVGLHGVHRDMLQFDDASAFALDHTERYRQIRCLKPLRAASLCVRRLRPHRVLGFLSIEQEPL